MSRTDLLSPEQRSALAAMQEWYDTPGAFAPFFLLQGYAGTGKTFLTRAFADWAKGRGVFTAPTNKATKVLRKSLTDDGFKPECATIFSTLGLRLEANGEVKELSAASQENPIDLSAYKYIVIDEGSMVNSALWAEVRAAQERHGLKFLVLADGAQLPPVGEARSPVFGLEVGAALETVMRHDNQILALATSLRRVIDSPAPRFNIASDNVNGEGVWRVGEAEFEARIREAARHGRFTSGEDAKAIAWRNVTVDRLNALIRKELYADAPRFVEGDRVIFTGPARDLDDQPMATTDDEGRVDKAIVDVHPTYGEFKVWRLSITLDTNKVVVARTLHEDDERAFAQRKERLAAEAKADKRRWRHFWDFVEAFHGIRHAYAITAHRSQGSTYTAAFVDWHDIMRNQTKAEAMRCLYVACTRPKKELYLG